MKMDGYIVKKFHIYFETNTNIKIDFEKSYEYEGSYRGYRWRPSSIKKELK